MVKISGIFLFLAVVLLFFCDLGISTYDPWQELARLSRGMFIPDISALNLFWGSLINTVSFALMGITLAIFFGILLSLFFHLHVVRLGASFIRSVHEIFWAFLLMHLVGLNSLCGILAIAIPYTGIFAKVYAEIIQEADDNPAEALAGKISPFISFIYAKLPLVYADLKNYTSYRFECALRSSAILGFIGLPTVGYHLETAFREGMYSEAAALLYFFYVLILYLQYWVKPFGLAIAFAGAIYFTSWEVTMDVSNIIRFFSYEILPWPMRSAGFYDGSKIVDWNIAPVISWVVELLVFEGIGGILNTIVLSQVSLVCTALFALVLFPFGCNFFFSQKVTWLGNLLFIILQTTSEYIIAYVLLQLWGINAPSNLRSVSA